MYEHRRIVEKMNSKQRWRRQIRRTRMCTGRAISQPPLIQCYAVYVFPYAFVRVVTYNEVLHDLPTLLPTSAHQYPPYFGHASDFGGARPNRLYKMSICHHYESYQAMGDSPPGFMNQLKVNARPKVAVRHTNTVGVNLPTVAA